MPKRFFDDEFKAKKVWVDFQRHQNSSTGYKLKSQISKNKQKTSVKHTLNSEVVIKITGASKDFGNLKAHLRYISRNGELEVFSKENEIFQGKQSLKDLANSFNDFYEILSEKELEKLDKKPKREALHIVFSMKGVMKTPVDKIKKAAEQTIKELYPHHYFVLAMHQDTDNPHCHMVLKMVGNDGIRINPNKADLANMRELFATRLRELGIKATATRKSMAFGEIKPKEYQGKEHKAHHYKIVDFGKAHFEFNENNDMSYYVKYSTPKGKEITIWAKDLERVINENSIQRGEYCRFAIVAETPREIRLKDKNNPTVFYTKVCYEKKWDVSVEGRLERVLNPLKIFTKSTFKTHNTSSNSLQEQVKNEHTAQNTSSFSPSKEPENKVIYSKEIKINLDIRKSRGDDIER